MAGKLPWMKFFPDDYLKDTQFLPLELQGFWMRLLCHMHMSTRRGYLLQANGQQWTLEHIALATGCDTAKAAHLRQCLISLGIASEAQDGTLFNRRMAREAEISAKRSAAGKKGARNSSRSQPDCHGKDSGLPRHPSGKGGGNALASSGEAETDQNVSVSAQPEPNPQGVGGVGGGENAAANAAAMDPAIDIAQRFSFVCTKRKGGGMVYYPHDGTGCVDEARELLRHVSYEQIVQEIEREDRNRSEWFGDMATRLCRNKANGTYHGDWKGLRHDKPKQAGGRTYRYDPQRDG